MRQITEAEMHTLEQLVDLCGLTGVSSALATICAGKAEHLKANWQDRHSARTWDRFANRMNALSELAYSANV